MEKGSEHPLGEAIWAEATARGLALGEPLGFQAEAGHGVEAEVDGRRVAVGNLRMMAARGYALNGLEAAVERLQGEAKTAMLVAVDGAVRGIIAVADTVKDGSQRSDRRSSSHELAGRDDHRRQPAHRRSDRRPGGRGRGAAEVLPGDKAAHIRELQGCRIRDQGSGVRNQESANQLPASSSEHAVVAMVGDGVNDAPALAQADVGMAIGTGTDVAMAAAPVTLISGDLRGVARAITLSRKTLRTIKQNLFWAFVYNIILIPAAALGYLNPMLAAGAMAFSSVFVVSNSLRLRRQKI